MRVQCGASVNDTSEADAIARIREWEFQGWKEGSAATRQFDRFACFEAES